MNSIDFHTAYKLARGAFFCQTLLSLGFDVTAIQQVIHWFTLQILTQASGVGGAVRFLVVGTIGQGERPPRGQLWMEQCLTSLKYWPI